MFRLPRQPRKAETCQTGTEYSCSPNIKLSAAIVAALFSTQGQR